MFVPHFTRKIKYLQNFRKISLTEAGFYAIEGKIYLLIMNVYI